jgi:monoamine oxidase
MSTVIVIGAGISGLSAALTLSAHHLVTVLEARNRTGGRIYTTLANDGKTPIELGASFWEGTFTNPFYLEYLQGSTVLLPFVNQDHQRAQQLLSQAIPHYAGKTCQALLDSLADEPYLVKKWIEHDLRHYDTPLSHRGFPQFAIPPDATGLEAWCEHTAHICFVRGGYHQVIARMEEQARLANITVVKDAPVEQIIDSATGVSVVTPLQNYAADKVISTIPIGVLKAKARTLFAKGLSEDKLRAIDTIGVHQATRVVLEFPKVFWDFIAPYIIIDEPDLPGFIEFRNGFALHGKPILQTDSYEHFVSALWEKKKTGDFETLLVDYIMQHLRKRFPHAPAPKHSLVYRWSSDPFAKGAYPYRSAQMTEALQLALEKPEGNIYFAGGDFSRHGFSVHNAYANGKSVAQQLLNDRSIDRPIIT